MGFVKNNNMTHKLTRRKFLKRSAGAAGALTVASLNSCKTMTPGISNTICEPGENSSPDDWLGVPFETDFISKTYTFDVIVVGAGLSGVCAARAATEEGASVALIEKSASFNCRSGEYALLGGTLNRRWGRENIVDSDTVVDYFMKECSYRIKRPILKKWADNAHRVMDWFIGAYPELTICDTTREVVTQEQYDKGILAPLAWPQPKHYDYREEAFPTYPSSMEFRSSRGDQQGFIVEAQLRDAEKNGAKVFYGCFGSKLLKNDTGGITGIVVRDAKNNNRHLRFDAKKGVILATGDNGGDDRIMKHFCPEILEKKILRAGKAKMMGVDVEGNPISTGDGLRLGAWAGAKVQDYHAPMTHHMGNMMGMGITPFLQINKHGKRFMNECLPGQQLENQIELQPEHTSFQIFDSDWGKQIPYMPANHGSLCYIIPEDEDESNPNFRDRQYTKISGKAKAFSAKDDTIEGLFIKLGFRGHYLDNAVKAVKRYNELAMAGKDEDFGKPSKRLFPLEKAPFYASKWGTTVMLVCAGGLESDEECHTFTLESSENPKRDVIPGLYVCGNVQGSRYAVEYPICMRGISHSLCMYYGYVAGKNCVMGI